jgi:predicted nuclease with TOPRIM domain
MFVHGKYFYGNEVSEYGQEHGYVDYRTLAKAFDAVMNNDIIQKTIDIGYWEQESGFVDNSEEIEELNEKISELMFNNDDDEHTEEIEELQERIDELEEAQDCMDEIFQYYIVSDSGARILKEINEIVFYNEELDMYVWGVTHWGTSWDYVLTDIKCNVPYDFE